MSLSIYVDAYSGFRANERPRLFQVDDDLYPIETVEPQWRTPEVLYFKVRATNGKRYLLRWHEQTDEWFLQSDYDGRELFDRRSVEIIAVDSVAIQEAESRIAGCEACRGDEAHVLFDWILADVLDKHGVYEFVLTAPLLPSRSAGTVDSRHRAPSPGASVRQWLSIHGCAGANRSPQNRQMEPVRLQNSPYFLVANIITDLSASLICV
jgi:hypothetical protein